jgi:RecB family endonuclease NucS
MRSLGESNQQMAIFQVSQKELMPVSATTFGVEGILERKDIQRMLRDQISVLDERLMVIAEEFGDWVDSSRRIDLLCIDADANLVVVELKPHIPHIEVVNRTEFLPNGGRLFQVLPA